ncbi:MAG TPA: PEP/pyruvate-binding domain-containing protein [Gemmataceae bacterium]|jgi:pyruvate,water dikinase|nr:PEP/pyruvate-binding domain-containing protein [Gemmataceae bacterium]
MSDIRLFTEINPSDGPAVGGKGLSLGLMTRAGLPVPPGFCIVSEVHRRHGQDSIPAELRSAIEAAYGKLGRDLVAVRSSATAEDGEATSFAGQQETILGVQGESAVIDAVQQCWSSLNSRRASAYRQKQGVADMAMAVVVQQLVRAEVAGVMFTRDPNDETGIRMVIEASWGLGETVVSGKVTPDRFVLERETGTVIEKHLGDKTVQRTPGGEVDVAPDWRSKFCLSDRQLAELSELGRKVEAHFGSPRDVEWAWADGRPWLLQARPITSGGAFERELVRQEEIAKLKALADPAGTVWGRFNLVEVLPEPTPMTWSIVLHFLSGQGGYGRMYADLGFQPDRTLDDECIYDLVCGRPYMNLSREPRMQWGTLPFGHSFTELKADSSRVPLSQASLMNGTGLFDKLRAVWRITRSGNKFQSQARCFARQFRQMTIPQFVDETTSAANKDWAKLEPPQLLEKLRYWVQRTLVTFARDSLKATPFAAVAMNTVQRQLEKPLGPERAKEAAGELATGVRPPADADLAAGLSDLASGAIKESEFLAKFGNRGGQEMELSQPRWNEDPAGLQRALAGAGHRSASLSMRGPEILDRIAAEARLDATHKLILRAEVNKFHTMLALREAGKHHLLRGYALIRRALVELDRQFELHGGIFFLSLEELPRLLKGESFFETITQRRKRRSLALSIDVPPVLFSDELEAIGRPQPIPEGADVLKGVGLSAGHAEGPALVLTDPSQDPGTTPDGFILVCPSTDPSWVPLFTRARGLVMETGGILSHGAIVAREFGLPAVAGLPGITRRLKTGERLHIDGTHGTVSVANS